MTLRLRFLTILSLTFLPCSVAFAQEPTDDPVIDLTPMLEVMPGEVPPQTDAPVEVLPETDVGPAPETVPETEPVPEAEIETPAPVDPAPTDLVIVAPEPTPETPVVEVDPAIVVSPEVQAPLPAYNRAEDAAGAEREVRSILQPFMTKQGTGILRLTGEVGTATMTFVLDNPNTVEDLRISLRSSINLLPEQSRLTFVLNGTEIDSRAPFSFDGFETMTLPREALVAGENTLVMRATHTHRIFCGPEATFQIWTEIDLGQSGALVADTAPAGDAGAFRRALSAQIASTGRVTVQSSESPDSRWLADLTQRVGAVLPGALPRLAVQSPFTPEDATGEIARITLLPADIPFVDARIGGDGARVLVIGGAVDSSMLDPWLPQPAPLNDAPALVPGTLSTLETLGRGEIVIDSRYGREDVLFVLPADWLLIASQSAQINLAYSYVDGLPQGSLMLVKVNGTTVRLLPLFGQGGVALPVLPVGYSARLLSPGVNVITFETIIPGDPPELPCAVIPGPFVRIDAGTALAIPDSPSMTFPRVATALRSLSPDGVSAVEGAAPNGIAAQSAAAIEGSFRPIAAASGGTLVVAGFGELDRAPLAEAGIARTAIEGLFAPAVAAAATEEPASGLVATARAWLGGVGRSVIDLARPGDPPLEVWLADRQAVAFLFLPDRTNPLSAWLVVAPGVSPEAIAGALSAARLDPLGPNGEAAILTPTATWESWRPTTSAPTLHEPLTIANFRTVAGNYASWSPFLFVAILGGLMSISVIVGLSFVIRTRGRRKR